MSLKRNFELYKMPFGKKYWQAAANEMRNIRSLVICALLSAIAIVVEKFQIPIIPNVLMVSFSFAVISLCSFLTGPVMAIPCGIIVDVVGALINGYEFFFGYTLSAVLGALIYALFLYRAPLTFERILASRLIINVFVNTLLGSVWRMMMSGGFYLYYAAISGVKNLLLLPLEVFVMVVFIRALLPSLKRLGLCDPSLQLSVTKKKIIVSTVILVLGTVIYVLYSLNKSEINAAIKGFIVSSGT